MAVVDLRYARALEHVAAEQKLDRDAVNAQLADFGSTLAGSRELREVLENPSLSEEQKLKVIDAVAKKLHMLPAVRNFIAVVVRHGRLTEFHDIQSAYALLADADSGVADAEITSAHPLDKKHKALLEEQVSKLTGGQKVRATYSEDGSLLGGVVVRVGSTVYDGSVRGQLQQLKQRLIAAAV